MSSGFISMVYAVLKQHDVDTSGMSVDEAIRKFDELRGSKDEQSNGGGEAKRVFDKADELGVDYDRDTNYQSIKAKVDDAGLIPYSEQEKQNYASSNKIIVAENEEQISKFISQVRNGQKEVMNKKLLLGKINKSIAERIHKATDVDLENYNVELRASDIAHALNRHGDSIKENKKGQSPLQNDDIKKFSNIVANFDEVEKGNKDRSLVFTKRVGNKLIAVTYYAEGNKSLSLKTMYIHK